MAERGAEAGMAAAGGRVVACLKQGKIKSAVLWSIPLAAAALVVWYVRK
jgi:hypothetical protein